MAFMLNIIQALGFDERAYWQLREHKKTVTAGALVVALVGLAYGLSNYFLFRDTLAGMMSSQASIVTASMVIIVSGLSIAYLVHGGVALLLWAISKGFRGPGYFLLLYGNFGIAMAPLIFAAPLVSYVWIAGKHPLAYLLAVPFFTWFLVLLIQGLRAAEGHSYAKATAVLVTTLIFLTSLLYLWLPW